MSPVGPEHFVIDTGPLLDYLVASFLARSPDTAEWLSDLLTQELRRDPLRTGLCPFVDSLKGRLVTCPGVMAELQHLVDSVERAGRKERSAPQTRRGDFWKHAVQEIARLGITEESVDIGRLNSARLESLGPVDATLIHVAIQQGTKNERVVLLTNEQRGGRALTTEATRAQVRVETLVDRVRAFVEEDRGRP